MNPIAIGAGVGAAAIAIGRGATQAIGNGLSFAAELARATAGGDKPQSTDTTGQAVLDPRIDDLSKRIEQQLAAAGIQLQQPVELVSNGQGGIAVAGSHPQAAAIEAALGSDVLLERDFNQLAGESEETGGQSLSITIQARAGNGTSSSLNLLKLEPDAATAGS